MADGAASSDAALEFEMIDAHVAVGQCNIYRSSSVITY